MLAAGASGPGFGAKLTDLEHTRIDEPRPPGVPSDEALEAAGAVIGTIDVDVRNIFDQSDPRETTGLFRLANRLHIRTKPSAIRAQLLFASGDRYRAKKLAETERNLRLLRFVYDAHVVPVRYADGVVDIKVITKDVWTLSPGFSFGRSGGTNSTSYDILDTNILGLGKTLEVSRGSTVDRTANAISWADPNVFGSHWTSQASYVDASDGSARSLQIAAPFYSLDTRWSATLSGIAFDRTLSRYYLGDIVDQFNDNESSYAFVGGLSSGVVDGWVKRLMYGMIYDRNIFIPAPGTAVPAKPLPPDRILSYPFVGFDILQDDFKKVGDENEIGRTEDLYLGTQVTASVGWSSGAFGANQNAAVLYSTFTTGYELPAEQQLFLNAALSARIEEGRARNLITDAGARYYWRWHENYLLYVSASGTVTDALDPDQQLLLGGDNGLRGYPLRYESGTSRALVTVEQRAFTDWYPFRLVRVGAAVFTDVGRTWGSGVIGNSDPGLLRDVGFGLRLGNTRTGLGNVVHVDFAFPLTNSPGAQRFQFLVQTMQRF